MPRPRANPERIEDVTYKGQPVRRRYGRWNLMHPAPARGYRKVVACKCDCGVEKEVMLQNLVRGLSESCGCLNRENLRTGHAGIFGTYWSRIQRNAADRGIEFALDIVEAWDLFETQGRRCALTGLDISLALTTKGHWNGEATASLDRINSSRGYSLDNVQWVHKQVNLMKMNLPETRFLELCQRVTSHHNRGSQTEVPGGKTT